MENQSQQPEENIELPWMPIFLDKMISGTDHMDAAEFGGYIRLLIEQFQKGHITSDIKKLKKLSRLNEARLQTVLEKFKKTADGNLRNKRCAIIREKQMDVYRGNKDRASKGGRARQLMIATAEFAFNSTQTNAADMSKMRQKSIDNEQWLQQSAVANDMPVDIVKAFCIQWITDAELRMMHQKHDMTTLAGFMISDMRKAKASLLPKKQRVRTEADEWY